MSFINSECAYWKIDQALSIEAFAEFTNEGVFESQFNGTHPDFFSSQGFKNEGVVTDFFDSFAGVSGFDNDGIVIPPYLTGQCFGANFTNVLLEGGNSAGNYNFANWYTDSQFTTLAGIYDPNLNVFTPNPNAVGVTPLFIEVNNTSAGCSPVAAPINLEVFELPGIAVSTVSPTCPGSETILDISISGGTPPFFYNWSVNTGEGNIANPTGEDATYTAPLSVGNFAITVTVTDNNNCSDTEIINVNVADAGPPVAICQDLTVVLDANGEATLTFDQVDNGSTDDCGITSKNLSQSLFTCSDVGTVQVQLTIMDALGNSDDCMATITVEDNSLPTAICQDITLQLDANGQAPLSPEAIDQGSTANCGVNLSIDQTDFSTQDIGDQIITLTAADSYGNIATCNATVTIEAYSPTFESNNPQLKIYNSTYFTAEDAVNIIVEDMDLLNEGHLDAGNSKVVFQGDEDNQLQSGAAVFYNLEMNKADGQKMRLVDHAFVTNNLNFNAKNNKIEIHDHNLSIGDQGSITGFDDMDYIQTNGEGLLKKSSLSNFTFPVGYTDSEYHPIVAVENGFPDEIGVRNLPTALDNGLTGNLLPDIVNTSWKMTEATEGNSNLDLTFQWLGADETGNFDRSNSGVAYWNGIKWGIKNGDIAAAQGSDPYQRSRLAVSELGLFTIGGPELEQGLTLSVTVFLQGAFDGGSAMATNLSNQNLVPTAAPYPTGNNETTTETVLDQTGPDAIVDWVLLELRQPETNIVDQRAALLKANGEVVDVDGKSPVEFNLKSQGNYFVAVKHRNHPGVMTAEEVIFGNSGNN